MKENIVPGCMKQYIRHEALICEVCMVIRALVLDDDIRVEFGKAHDHAKLLADLYLTDLIQLLSGFIEIINNPKTMMLSRG